MAPSSPVFLLMGVSGVGKTAVGHALAHAVNGAFLDGDEYHLAKHINGLSAGIPLNDLIRKGWLRRICGAIERTRMERPAPIFVACSALKKTYRDFIRGEVGPICIFHLTGKPSLIRERMMARRDHFMPVSLLESQLSELEPPTDREGDVHMIDISQALSRIVANAIPIVEKVAATPPPAPAAGSTDAV